MEHMEKQPVRRGLQRKSMVIGLLVLSLGAFWLMRNYGIISELAWDYIFSWQMLLIAIGLINVIGEGHKGFGWILIAIGGFFLLSDIFDWPLTFRNVFWPALLIVIGLALIFGSQWKFRRKLNYKKSEGEDILEDVSVFGGGERVIHSENFKGGEVISVFGGSKIDLTHTTINPDGAEIEIVAVFGGSTLLVPSDWNVKLEVFNIFGGFSDKRMRAQVDNNKVLVVKGVAIFGGGELKSF
jgi:predicted membrane protein